MPPQQGYRLLDFVGSVLNNGAHVRPQADADMVCNRSNVKIGLWASAR
jgi:hypothetical protein